MVPDDDATRLLDNCIFELIPMKSALEKAAFLPEGATVSVTASPDKGMEPTIDLALQLTERGLDVIPHLSARATRTRSELETIITRLKAAGIKQIFVVGGDAAEPGDFFDALELLEALHDLGHPFSRIGITGYPEGHPGIPDEQLMIAMMDKLPYASYVATQLCFDPATIERWISTIRTRGISLPIYLGVAGAVDPVKLLTIGARIGVGRSLRYLRKNRKAITSVIRGGVSTADHLLAELAPTSRNLGIAGLHVFTFNAVAETTQWWRDGRSRS
jgi:methylenetetrahydrofolate reductase (NADH)